ncbi:hypothetical protein [Pseudoxanthomonas winnipegensis]|uniref:Uncharacterized protein n=1 Tax=Pseudoxanthomonas winnipegensis TaxID=2480810 RepID=A0A4Q8M1C1_9GAMM|nr:hypothetical protein [Pseudoxanthomonas winnipegensis]RZZ86980.1 hypothetical protein EA663_08930 [Pseudoxanthomonas winnipegensis]TAA37804.1 hypothetical protein EA656_03860 [Pseudoxanthomonas winnipegensis]TBV76425.1 hypothetical protein EYC46_07950 [Pseudoxanthomonas winnipegensis]
MNGKNDVKSDLYDLTIPLLAIFQQVAMDGNLSALNWSKLEEIVRGAMAVGCASQSDVDDVVGTSTTPKKFNAERLGEIYQCLDGKIYGMPGRLPDVIGTIKGLRM